MRCVSIFRIIINCRSNTVVNTSRCAGLMFGILLIAGCEQKPPLTTDSSEARKHYTQGLALLHKFYFVEAKTALQQACVADSNFAMAYARLAMLYQRSGNEDSARQYILTAVRKADAASSFEKMFIRMLDHALHARHTEALHIADSLTRQYPSYAEGYVLLGDYHEKNRNADAALEAYKKAVQADPSYAPAVMSLGYAYSTRGNTTEAVKAMERYIALVPDAADPRASLADIFLRVGRYAEALAQYQASLERKPDYWYAINRIGDIYSILGRLNDAEQQYERGMSMTLEGVQTRAMLLSTKAGLQLQRGKLEEALRLYQETQNLDSTNLHAAFGRVYALVKLNRLQDAEVGLSALHEHLRRRNLTATNAMVGFHLIQARLLLAHGRYEQALAACDSAMEYGSELARAEVFHQIARLYLSMGNYEGAFDALDEALRYNPNNPHILLTLAKVYNATGDQQMTRAIGHRVLELWRDADTDFQPLAELKEILKLQAPARGLPQRPS